MLSFWEKDAFLEYDFIVVGGGIVGLSTAIELKEAQPKASVLLLEAGQFPTGASTKNAGFACFGSLTEILADLEKLSASQVQDLVALRWNGLHKLRERLGDKAIAYQNYGGYELLETHQLKALERIDEVNQLLRPVLGGDAYLLEEDPKRFGFDSARVEAIVFNPFEGQIHTGKMMKALQQKAAEIGVEVLTGLRVHEVNQATNRVEVVTEDLLFTCAKAAVCTNAFTHKLIPDLELKPGRGVVLVTNPIPQLPFKGTFHYEEGYYYFRNYKDRVIFGGGRNLDIEGEESTDFEVSELIKSKLIADLESLILPNTSFEIDHFWSGIMAFGPNKQPILKQVTDNVFAGVRLGGMGVAIGSKLGYDLANKMLA